MRYAINRDIKIEKILSCDVAIVGAGLAGLYAALNIDARLSCIVLAKESIDISSSWLAQGGIAAALGCDDSPEQHLKDTLTAGAGLCNADAAKTLVNEGPADIKTLVSLCVPFDLDENGKLQLTREGGHSKRRVVHAGGDATGRETTKTLASIVRERENIAFYEHTSLYDILTADDVVTGLVVRHSTDGYQLINTNNVIIATGGVGQVYKLTTNPTIATGGGVAAAKRAGAKLSNMEFVQFHPTGLWEPDGGGAAFLISEAVRGEGGLLVNSDGDRFMLNRHEMAELAPRDIVARGIVMELMRSGETHAYIDITSKPEDYLKRRFPTIYGECLLRGINIASDRIPVYPAQHYFMGGIETDLDGRTNIEGLYACGESACTGVHGANRLASNSMLECLVFGRRAATCVNNLYRKPTENPTPRLNDVPMRPYAKLDFASIRCTIRQLMNNYCCVIRNKAGLEYALERVAGIVSQLEPVYDDDAQYLETLNTATVAESILAAALDRRESVGSHFIKTNLVV